MLCKDSVDESCHIDQHYRPRGPQRDFILESSIHGGGVLYDPVATTVPPLRAFLRVKNEGIDTDFVLDFVSIFFSSVHEPLFPRGCIEKQLANLSSDAFAVSVCCETELASGCH